MTTSGKHQPASQADTTDNLAHLAERLRAIGQRATPQRLMILSALETGEHLTADEVYCRIAGLSPAINRSTVYRTLELFRDLGVVSETDLGGGVREFELLDKCRHHHLVCHECGAIIEIDDTLVEPLRHQALQRYGFAADIDHLALFGRCRQCGGG
jgi:Fur family ferric uptake transcriptional regulator